MKRNHFLICCRLLRLGNEILPYVAGFNIAADDDDGKFSVEHQWFSFAPQRENSLQTAVLT